MGTGVSNEDEIIIHSVLLYDDASICIFRGTTQPVAHSNLEHLFC